MHCIHLQRPLQQAVLPHKDQEHSFNLQTSSQYFLRLHGLGERHEHPARPAQEPTKTRSIRSLSPRTAFPCSISHSSLIQGTDYHT